MNKEQIIEELDKYDSNFELETGEGIQAIWFYDFGKVADGLVKLFSIHSVSKSVAKQYAEFCVRCDREGLPLLELDDYIKQYCC